MSPLRQRMLDAMVVRSMSPRTIECYTESIARLCHHYGGCMPANNRAAQDFMARVARVNISQCPACEHGRLCVVQTLAGLKRLPDPLGQAQTQAPTQATTGRPAAKSRAPPRTHTA